MEYGTCFTTIGDDILVNADLTGAVTSFISKVGYDDCSVF
jgi:hypothetical protein